MQTKIDSFSPSSAKPLLVVEDWQKKFSANIKIVDFTPFKKTALIKCHDYNYVNGIFDGSISNGFNNKESSFAKTFLYTNASIYYAALDALQNKVAISPTSGFHHAHYDKAEGFCTFNGLVLSAILLKENQKLKRIGILDFDMHYGNGTENIIEKLKIDFIEHYSAGKYYDLNYPKLGFLKSLVKKVYSLQNHDNTQDNVRKKLLKNKAQKFLEQIPIILNNFKNCDIILYQAGADQHENDPYGGLLSYDEMKLRDAIVFEFAKNNNIPIAWNLAGGYQKDSNNTIEPILKCHRNTLEQCILIFKT
jgi:acetoin utilization deacetylase AcuC-like enzyme